MSEDRYFHKEGGAVEWPSFDQSGRPPHFPREVHPAMSETPLDAAQLKKLQLQLAKERLDFEREKITWETQKLKEERALFDAREAFKKEVADFEKAQLEKKGSDGTASPKTSPEGSGKKITSQDAGKPFILMYPSY